MSEAPKRIDGKESLKDGSGPEGWNNPSPWSQQSKKPADWVLPGTNISKEHKFKPNAFYDETMVKDTSASSGPPQPPPEATGSSSGGKPDPNQRWNQNKDSVYRASYEDAHPARKYMNKSDGATGGGIGKSGARKPKTNQPRQSKHGKGPTIDPVTGDFVYK